MAGQPVAPWMAQIKRPVSSNPNKIAAAVVMSPNAEKAQTIANPLFTEFESESIATLLDMRHQWSEAFGPMQCYHFAGRRQVTVS
jgi:hypothetical protein